MSQKVPVLRTKEENQRHRQILDSVWNPRVLIHPAESPVDVQQPSGLREEVPPEQEDWNLSLDQEEPEPKHIKEEQEELWTNQEADIPNVPPTSGSVKREDDDDEEEAQSSVLRLRQCEEKAKERDEEDTGGSGPNTKWSRVQTFNSRAPGSRRSLQKHMDTHRQTRLVDSECFTAFWQETDAPRNELTDKNFALNDIGFELRPFQCSDCDKTFGRMCNLVTHRRVHKRLRQFDCSVCGKIFGRKSNLVTHMKIHTGEKSFSCPVCQKRFRHKCVMQVHMTTHTGEKAFVCTECGKKFSQKPHLVRHMKCHVKKKPVSL